MPQSHPSEEELERSRSFTTQSLAFLNQEVPVHRRLVWSELVSLPRGKKGQIFILRVRPTGITHFVYPPNYRMPERRSEKRGHRAHMRVVRHI